MQLPLTDPDTLFADLLQDLPLEVSQLARECRAFVRAKKIKTPEQLLRVVLLYCGLDQPLREVAGTFTALYESITDQSVAERLRACGPWVKALLRDMLPLAPVAPLPEGKRFLVIDASTVQAPGATGTDHRLHLCMDLVSLEFVEVLVTDVHSGETLKHFTLTPGDVAVADRGYAHPSGMSAAVQQGAELIVRLNPFSVVLTTPTGQPLALGDALRRQQAETIRTLAVVIGSACGQYEVRGWVHAYRLSAEQANRARQKCRQRHKTGQPQAETLFLAGWVLVFTTLAPAVLSAKTILAVYRCRWQVAVSREGSITQSVQVRPRRTDSGLVAREAPGRESQPVKPSDNPLGRERAQRSRLQRAVNADVASLHAIPVAEPVYYGRRQQGPGEKSLQRRSSPAGYQR